VSESQVMGVPNFLLPSHAAEVIDPEAGKIHGASIFVATRDFLFCTNDHGISIFHFNLFYFALEEWLIRGHPRL
jgi:hypothetical protein